MNEILQNHLQLSQFIIDVMVLGVIVGAIDYKRGNKWGLGNKFEEAFSAFFPLLLMVGGIIVLVPLMGELLSPVLSPLFRFLGADPAMFSGMLLSCDMGAYPLAGVLTDDPMAADFSGEAKAGISSGQFQKVILKRAKEALPSNYRVEWTGMSYQEQKNQGQILYLLLFSLVCGYLFLVAQYESWTIPVPVILSVAVATLGALIGLLIWKLPLSIYAQLGLVMLVGLASKNAILMVEFAKEERANGASVNDAALTAATLRFRAVLMTAWSFILGVLPLVIASGAGAGSRKSIGVTTFAGMTMATVVGIAFIPPLYAVCQKMREYFQQKRLSRRNTA